MVTAFCLGGESLAASTNHFWKSTNIQEHRPQIDENPQQSKKIQPESMNIHTIPQTYIYQLIHQDILEINKNASGSVAA